MNPVVKEIVSYKYKDKTMRKQAFIYKRSKNKRIQDKSFNKLFIAFLEENPVKIIGDVVLIKGEYYFEMKRTIEKLKAEVEPKYLND